MMKKGKVQVMVTQGDCLLQDVLIERLKLETWMEICATTSKLEEAPALIEQHWPDVLLMNVSLKCSAGLSALGKFKRSYVKMAVLTFSCDSEFEDLYAGLAFRAGADGYVSSRDTSEDIIRAIRSVRAGKQYISPHAKATRRKMARQEKVLSKLSKREAEVFCLTGCGFVPQRIADKLNLKVKTIETYRERIRAKMHLTGADLLYVATSFMRSAARQGLDGPDDLLIGELL